MKKKGIIGLIIVIVAGVVIWQLDWIKQKLTKLKGGSDLSEGESEQSENSGSIDYKDCGDKLPLKLGCKGKGVLTVQKALNKIHNAGLTADGLFGPSTEKACVRFGYGKTIEGSDIVKMTKQLKERN